MFGSNIKIFIAFLLAMICCGVSYWVPGLWFFSFFISIPILYALDLLRKSSLAKVFWWGFLLGILFLLVGLPPLLWVESAAYGDATGTVVFIIGIIGFFAAVSIFYGSVFGLALTLFLYLARWFPSQVSHLLWFALIWVGAELILRVFTFGFDWWLVGVPLADAATLRQLANIGGVPLLSWYALEVGAVSFVLSKIVLTQDFSKNFVLAALGVAALLGGWGYGFGQYKKISLEKPSDLRIALLQPNKKFPSVYPVEQDPDYGPLMKKALAKEADLVVFPAQIRAPLTKEQEISKSFWVKIFGKSFLESGVTVATYIPVETSLGNFQTMYAIKDGQVEGTYQKEILFPVSDYLPRGFFGLLFPAPRYSITPHIPNPDDKNGVLLADNAVGGVICNEPFSPRILERMARSGSKIILLLGSDRPFESNLIFQGTLRMARLRASQGRVWVLRAQKTGISAVIAPNGDISEQLGRNERGIIIWSRDGIYTEKL